MGELAKDAPIAIVRHPVAFMIALIVCSGSPSGNSPFNRKTVLLPLLSVETTRDGLANPPKIEMLLYGGHLNTSNFTTSSLCEMFQESSVSCNSDL